MRVLLTTESYLPYISGVTISIDSLARGLGAQGHEVLVLAPRPQGGALVSPVGSPGPAPRHAWLDSYQAPRVAPPGYRMPWPNPAAPALRQARDFHPDVVHAHSPFVSGVAARMLARAAGAPLVFTHHTRFAGYGHYLGPLARPGARATDLFLRGFWGGCAAIIAPSADLAAEIRARLPVEQADRVHVIPTGIDVDAIQALAPIDPRPAAGWSPDDVVVGALGRLAPEKSPELLMEAVARAADNMPGLRLLSIGSGPSAPDLRMRAARHDLVGRVTFTGARPRMEALARIAGADLFGFTSRTETQGLVLAEALASGLPAIAVDGPGVRDSIRDGVDGIVVSADPAESLPQRLAAVLLSVASDPGRRAAMRDRARGDADRFSVQRRVGEVAGLYARLQAQKQRQ